MGDSETQGLVHGWACGSWPQTSTSQLDPHSTLQGPLILRTSGLHPRSAKPESVFQGFLVMFGIFMWSWVTQCMCLSQLIP